MHRYPEDTVATIADLKSSRWKAAVAAADKTGYSAIWQALSKAASSALDEGKAAESKVLWLLADSCSMMLKPKSLNEPFAPMAVFDGRRSALPEDFSETDIALLAASAAELDNDLVRARIGDLVWLCKKPRSVVHALLAIDAYRSVPLDSETWVHDARDCWARAISLSMQLRAGAGARLQDIESALLEGFANAGSDTGFFRLSVARLMYENNLGQGHARDMAKALAAHGTGLVQAGAHYEARGYLDAAAQWYGRAGEREKQADMTCAVAETWAGEALARRASSQPSNIVASSFYENAIQTYRRVPRALRTSRRVDERIAALHADLEASGKASLDEMGVVSSGPIDISELVEEAQASVRGKPLLVDCNA